MHGDDDRVLRVLVRDVARSEATVIEHARRGARRLGEVPPVAALRDAAHHVACAQRRFHYAVGAYAPPRPGGALAALRWFVEGHLLDPEAAYRAALGNLRRGVERVEAMREIARGRELLAVMRWCDDWLGLRRMLVAAASAQLAWFASRPLPVGDWHADRNT
ncbi:MAG TPA: hypothetical protein VLX92_21045 [Kofleriaceae bacterium]|nr:hypothetical protein [Kofleriaceae bacterium]